MKKLKFFVPAVICAVAVFSSCNNKPASEEASATAADSTAVESTYTVNTDSTSAVKWKGVMLGVKEHFGTINFKEGSLTVKGGQLVSGNFTIDLSTIKATDGNYDAKSGYTADKLIAHLSSPDFFDVANHPTATFAVTSVEGNTAKGTLTIRGKSNEEQLTGITITESEGTVKATGALKFNRQKYDVKYPGPAKDMVISDNVELTIELSGKK